MSLKAVVNSGGGGGGGSGITRSVNVVSSATAAGATALKDYVYLCSGTMTLTLPTAVGNTNRYTAENSGSGTITVATTSAQTINGASSYTLDAQYESIDLISDDTNWKVI